MSGMREALRKARELGRMPERAPSADIVEATTATPSMAEILAMSCTEFAKANLVVLIRSALLGDDIVLASNETAAARASREHAVLFASEILELYKTGRLDVEALKLLHRAKRGLGDARLLGIDGNRRPGGPRHD